MAINFLNNATFAGAITIPEYIVHSGDTDTFFGFVTDNEYKVTVGNSTKIFADVNSAYLYHQGNLKLQTTSTGVTITGGWVTSGVSVATANVEHTDNVKSLFGNGNDLEIYHDGSNSHIKDTGTGFLIIEADPALVLQNAGGEPYLQAISNGAVQLYFNNSEKLATTDTGVSITGSATFTGGATFTGEVEVALASNQIKLSTGTTGDGHLNIGHFSNGTFIGTYGDDGGAADLIRFGTHSGDERMRIDSSGNVGIGTTSPVGKVEVLKNGGTSDIVITSDTLALLQLKDSTLTKTYNIEIGRSASAGDLTFRSVSGEKVRFTEGGNVGIGDTNPTTKLSVDGTVKVTGSGTGLLLYGTGGGGNIDAFGSNPLLLMTNSTERLRITSAGNVGIGTTSPGVKLDVRLSTATGKVAELHNDVGYGIGFTVQSDAGVNTINSETNQALAFATNGASNERMRINIAGNVGIGTTSPTHLLTLETASSPSLKIKDTTQGATLLAFSQDSSSHIGTYSNHPLVFDTNSTEKIRITSSAEGHVELSGTAPVIKATASNGGSGLRINIAGQTTGQLFRVQEDGATKFQINENGDVGIGITSPTSQLHLSKAGGTLIKLGTSVNTSEIEAREVGGGQSLVLSSVNSADHLVIDGSGNVGIGTDSPTVKFEISESGAANLRLTSGVSDGDVVAAVISFSNAAGSGGVQGRIENVATEDNDTVFKFYNDSGTSAKMTLNPNGNMTIAGTLTQNSDASLKENVKEIDNALSKVKQLQGVEFNKIGNNKKEIGVIAQDVEKVLPELVLEEDGVKSVAYGNITAVLIEAIKEQQEQIEQLKKQIQLLNK